MHIGLMLALTKSGSVRTQAATPSLATIYQRNGATIYARSGQSILLR